MTRHEFESELIPLVSELWPRYDLTRERNGAVWRWFCNYVITDLCRCIRFHYDDNPDTYPKWRVIRDITNKRCKQLGGPKWGWSDELNLRQLMARNMDMVDRGVIDPKYSDEYQVLITHWGYIPPMELRDEALTTLATLVRDSLIRRGRHDEADRITADYGLGGWHNG